MFCNSHPRVAETESKAVIIVSPPPPHTHTHTPAHRPPLTPPPSPPCPQPIPLLHPSPHPPLPKPPPTIHPTTRTRAIPFQAVYNIFCPFRIFICQPSSLPLFFSVLFPPSFPFIYRTMSSQCLQDVSGCPDACEPVNHYLQRPLGCLPEVFCVSLVASAYHGLQGSLRMSSECPSATAAWPVVARSVPDRASVF